MSPVFYSDKIFRPVHWLRRGVDAIYNLLVPRLSNRFISTQISNSIQGSDRPGAVAVAVRPHPGWDYDYSAPLPPSINKKLVNLANLRATEAIPKLRSLLYSFDEGCLHILAEDSIEATAALVHNNYFRVKEIISIITNHIVLSSNQGSSAKTIDPSIQKWILDCKHLFEKQMEAHRFQA